MTLGGTVERTPTLATHDAARRARWVDDPRLVEHLPAALAVVAFLGVFLRIRQRWFIPGFPGAGYTEWVVRSTVEGTAIAPNQYRPLMPWVMTLVADIARVPLPTAIVAVDGIGLLVALVLLHQLATRLGARSLMLPAAACWAWFAVKLEHWHPEIMLMTVIVLAATLLLLDRRAHPVALLTLGLVACGARTDYAAGLGLILLVVSVHRRQLTGALAGIGIGAAALSATVLFADVLYPQARYLIDVVQIPFNLAPYSWAFVTTFYLPLLAVPALLALRRRALPPLAVVLAWFLLEFAATFVVGRPEESRLFMPLAPVLGVAAAAAWLELRAGTTTAEATAT